MRSVSLSSRFLANVKYEKNRFNILVDPWPVTARKTDEQTFTTFLIKENNCCHLVNYSAYSCLHKVFESHLKIRWTAKTLFSLPSLTSREKKVWQEGQWLHNVVKRGKIGFFSVYNCFTNRYKLVNKHRTNQPVAFYIWYQLLISCLRWPRQSLTVEWPAKISSS